MLKLGNRKSQFQGDVLATDSDATASDTVVADAGHGSITKGQLFALSVTAGVTVWGITRFLDRVVLK